MSDELVHLRAAASHSPRERLQVAGTTVPVRSAAVIGVGWLGGTIFRLIAHLFDHFLLVDHDSCTAATPVAGITKISDLGRPKVQAAAEWAQQHVGSSVSVLPVTYPVQLLGLGFWRYLARGGIRVWCALDNPFAVAAIAHACRRLELPLITANMDHAQGLIRVFPGKPSSACYHCLGIGLTRVGKSCLDVTATRFSAPTIASLGTAEIVASIAVQHGLAAHTPEASYELRWSQGTAGSLPLINRSALQRATHCTQPHDEAQPSKGVQINLRSSEVTLADVRQASGQDPTARILLDGGGLTSQLQCARRCGATPIETLRMATTLALKDICPACGGELVPSQYAGKSWTGCERVVSGKSLHDLALPLWPVLRVQGPGGVTEVEVAGDRLDLLTGDGNDG